MSEHTRPPYELKLLCGTAQSVLYPSRTRTAAAAQPVGPRTQLVIPPWSSTPPRRAPPSPALAASPAPSFLLAAPPAHRPSRPTLPLRPPPAPPCVTSDR